jgi:protease I
MTATNGATLKRVAILIEHQFEDSEFQVPYTALEQAGATVVVLGSRMNDNYEGKRGALSISPDATATEVRAEDFDAIIIPGGAAPDKIRTNPNAVRLITDAMEQGKLIAAVCHGPQVLIEADLIRDRQVTGYRAIRKDIQNAGANYHDEPVVIDGNLITARQPSDLAAFSVAILKALNLTIPGLVLPDVNDRNFEWWTLAERWEGSSRNDIINMINTFILGERYTLEAFKQYGDRILDPEIRQFFSEVVQAKQHNFSLLESRLHAFNERLTWQTVASDAYAKLQTWLQSQDEREILRRALGDLQTGVVDAFQLASQVTDPITADIFMQVELSLSKHERRLAEIYRSRVGNNVHPPAPTTVAVS